VGFGFVGVLVYSDKRVGRKIDIGNVLFMLSIVAGLSSIAAFVLEVVFILARKLFGHG